MNTNPPATFATTLLGRKVQRTNAIHIPPGTIVLVGVQNYEVFILVEWQDGVVETFNLGSFTTEDKVVLLPDDTPNPTAPSR